MELVDRDSYFEGVEQIAMEMVNSPRLASYVGQASSRVVRHKIRQGLIKEFWTVAKAARAANEIDLDAIDLIDQMLTDQVLPEEIFVSYAELARSWHSSKAIDRLFARWNGTWLASCVLRPGLLTLTKPQGLARRYGANETYNA